MTTNDASQDQNQDEKITEPSLPASLDRARAGYEAYARFTNGKTFDGRDMPSWDALPERIRHAWASAAAAILAQDGPAHGTEE